MYADDTCLHYSFDSVDAMNQAINADLIALKGWLEGNKLSLYVAKTEAMIIGSNKKLRKIDTPDTQSQFRIGSEDVKLVSDVKYLGVQSGSGTKMDKSFNHCHEKDLQGYWHSSLCKAISSTRYD